MTFTEDDLRSVKSRQSPYNEQQNSSPIQSETPPRTSTPKRTPTPTRLLTPLRVATPPVQKVIPFRPTTIERRLQINKILADEEREYQLRKNENEAHLKEQLKHLEEERKSSRNLSNAKGTYVFPKNEYKRFSNSRYYKWDSDEDLQKQNHHHHHRREHFFEDPLHDDEQCELCRRGLEQERLEREKRLAKLRSRSQSEHCRTIQRFVKEVNDAD
uniref:Uncharacterized protein n=1 Tax=Panagrolaimus sp. PS1159 TaxID=55785 RepID=A0AC35GN78_9BILA